MTKIPPNRWIHVAKRCVNDALLRIPPVAKLNGIRAALRTGSMNDPDYLVGILGTHLRRLREHGGSLDGMHALELGPGNSLGQGMLLCALGAESVTAVDVAHFANERSGRGVYATLAKRLPGHVSDGTFPAAVRTEDLAARLAELLPYGAAFPAIGGRLRYEITDGRHLPLPNDSVNFIYSCSVLEHVKEIGLAYDEMARVLRPGGMMSQMIDLEDHAHPDPYDFLRYGDRLWDLMQGRSPGAPEPRTGSGRRIIWGTWSAPASRSWRWCGGNPTTHRPSTSSTRGFSATNQRSCIRYASRSWFGGRSETNPLVQTFYMMQNR